MGIALTKTNACVHLKQGKTQWHKPKKYGNAPLTVFMSTDTFSPSRHALQGWIERVIHRTAMQKYRPAIECVIYRWLCSLPFGYSVCNLRLGCEPCCGYICLNIKPMKSPVFGQFDQTEHQDPGLVSLVVTYFITVWPMSIVMYRVLLLAFIVHKTLWPNQKTRDPYGNAGIIKKWMGFRPPKLGQESLLIMNKWIRWLPCRHRIHNVNFGGLRSSSLPLGHGGSSPYLLITSDQEGTILSF